MTTTAAALAEKMKKKELRREFLARRKALSPAERRLLDAAIASRIAGLECWARAKGVVAYAGDGQEPDLSAVCRLALAEKKTLALPRFEAAAGVYQPVEVTDLGTDLVTGKYGLMEPRAELPAAAPDADWIWLIPGVAFDAAGTRLGRGKGYYDRLLAVYGGVKIGVFYRMQFFAGRLPCAAHDRKLDLAVTEIETVKFDPARADEPAAPEQLNQRKNQRQCLTKS